MAVDPATLGLSAAVSLFSSRSARRKASRQRRRANVIRDLSAPGEPQDLPRIYGRYGAEGVYVDARGPKGDYAAGNALRQGGASDRRRVFRGWLDDGYFNRANSGIQFDAGMTVTDPDGAGTETEFVLALWAFADGQGHRPYWLQVDGASHDAFYLNYGQRFEVDMKGGRANALATANGFPSTHIFTDCPYALGAMRLAFPAQYTDIPRVKLFGEWRLVRTVNASNVLSTTRSYSNNRVWCLLDYLLDADIGGLFGATDIDLASFRAAALVADTFVDTLPDGTGLAFDRHGSVWRRPGESWPDGGWRDNARHEVPEWWLDFTHISGGRVHFAPRSGPGHSDAPNGPRNQPGVTIRTAARFHAGGKEWKFDWSNVTGTQGDPAEDFSIAVTQIRDAETNAAIQASDYTGWNKASVSSCWPEIRSSSTADSKYRLRLYEMNGPLDSEGSVRENIDGFMQGFDNAALYLVGTTLHISVINATTQTQADALVLHELDDDDFIEPPEVAMRDRAETATRVRGRFHDAAMDGAEREVLWPPAGDAAAYATGLAANGGVASERSVFLVGVDNIVHAEASVRSIHQQSNGATDIQLHLPLAYHTLRPNNVVAVTIQGTRVVCLVEELEIDDDAESDNPRPRVVATLSTFDWTDTAWNTSAAMADPLPGAGDGGVELPQPIAVTATLGLGRRVDVTWDFGSRRLDGGFVDVERMRGASSAWEGAGIVPSDVTSYPDTVGLDGETYTYRVRYRNSAGRTGAWLESNEVTITALSLVPSVGTARIYKRSSTPVPNTDLPTGTATFTFSTMETAFASGGANGWSGTVPMGTDTLYTRTALAVGSGATVDLAPSAWGPALAGAVAGADGANFGIAELWTATDDLTPPMASTLPDTVTWQFVPPRVTTGLPANSIWKRTQVEAGLATGRYLWVARAAAASGAAVQLINRADFSIALHSRVGLDGEGQEEIWRLGTLADRTAYLANPGGWTGLPANAFPYDQPVAPWVDNQPTTTPAMPVAFRAVRPTPVTAEAGDPSGTGTPFAYNAGFGPWQTAALVLYGADGMPGARAGGLTVKVNDREAMPSDADGLGQYAVVPNPSSDWSDFLSLTAIHVGSFQQTGMFNVVGEYLVHEVTAGAVLTFYVGPNQWADYSVTSNNSSGNRGAYAVTLLESATPETPAAVTASTAVEIRIDQTPNPIREYARSMYKISATEPADSPAPTSFVIDSDVPFQGGNLNGWSPGRPTSGRGNAAKVWARDIRIVTRRPTGSTVAIPLPQPWSAPYLDAQDGAGTERVYWQGAAAGQTETTTQVPRSQTFTLQAPTTSQANIVRWSNVSFGGDALDAAFVDGGATAYPRRLDIAAANNTPGSTQNGINFRVASTDSTDGSAGGPQLTTQWEGNFEFVVTFGAESWTFAHDDFVTLDSTEPYNFRGFASQAALTRARAAATAIGSNAGATVQMRDGTTVEGTTYVDTPAATPPILNNNWPVGQPVAPWQSTQPAHAYGFDIYVAERNPTQSTAWVGPTLLPRPLEIVKVAAGDTPSATDIAAGSGKLVVRSRT